MLYSCPSENNKDRLNLNFSGRFPGAGGAIINAYREAVVEVVEGRFAVDDGEDLEIPGDALDVWFLEGFFSSVGFFEDDDFEEALEDDVAGGIGPTRLWKSLYLVFNLSNGLTCFLIPLR
jgi:hypothetical protein